MQIAGFYMKDLKLFESSLDKTTIRISGSDPKYFLDLLQDSHQTIQSLDSCLSNQILIQDSDPGRFLAHVLSAQALGWSVFLASHHWGKIEWQQALNIFKRGWILQQGTVQLYADENQLSPNRALETKPWILIPTGGSSGQIRFAIHTQATLTASVQGFLDHFHLSSVNSLCVLPLYHVSGLMQVLRSGLTHGSLFIYPWKTLESGEIIASYPDPTNTCLSLVPTQLQKLLDKPEIINWLTRFQFILLGGAPAGSRLLEIARAYRIPLAPTYGMTETASQVATLTPTEFLAGNNSSGRILPHLQVRILKATKDPDQAGQIEIQGSSLALGYYPEIRSGALLTSDLGYLDPGGYLYIQGRSDQIISGGEKIQPAEVEALLRHWVEDVCVIGVPDPLWGEKVIAVYVADQDLSESDLRHYLLQHLSSYKIPKQWIRILEMPRNSQGKLNRKTLIDLIGQLDPTIAAAIATQTQEEESAGGSRH
jgi:O-succinylbenzoic acid--CoA ligase